MTAAQQQRTQSLIIGADAIACVLALLATPCPIGARALSLMARTCKLVGLKGQLDNLSKDSTEPSMVVQIAQDACKELGVHRLPLAMGDDWCWSRMLSWLSQAVRVGAQCELKTIEDGVDAADGKVDLIKDDGDVLVESSLLVLVEPGVYEEEVLQVDGGQRVSIWRCDREGESNKKEMQKAEWRSGDGWTLVVNDEATVVSVNGMHMSAVKSEGYDGEGFSCVLAEDEGTLCLEGCDLTCEDQSVVEFSYAGTTARMSGCCVHDGKQGGVLIHGGASATLENNNIHSNTKVGVEVQDQGTVAMLRSNTIHDGMSTGVSINGQASATLENNTITDNDLAGVQLTRHATATLTGNTTKGNGQCKIERAEEEFVEWPDVRIDLYRSTGFPGVRVLMDSTVTMLPGSNTIEGNGKLGSSGEQVVVDGTSLLTPQYPVTVAFN